MTIHEEISNLLRSALRGEVEARIDGLLDNWWEVSNPPVSVGGWHLTLFIEADSIYEIWDAKSPEGRTFEFQNEDAKIEQFLNEDEVEALCLKLGRAKK